jgi:hypothetical protein
LNINPKTVARKLRYLAGQAREKQKKYLKNLRPRASVQFDELQTIEHSKLKPLAIPLAVCAENRTILAYRVAVMPATGLLSQKSIEKYGKRPDKRPEAIKKLFNDLKKSVREDAHFLSDKHPYYPNSLAEIFPKATHETVKGRPSSVAGQGELKKGQNDPLFSLNHTCAMFRAHINRLIRKTWCTTKKISALKDHLALYVDYHNRVLTSSK